MSSQGLFCAALLDAQLPAPEVLRVPNEHLEQRFAVYRNNVISSLIDALADTFPVVQQLVGNEFFRAMAQVFVRQAPPTSRVLAEYGAGFAAFIAQFAPAASVPYLADIARLEFAQLSSLHSADCAPISAEALQALLADSEQLSQAQLVLAPNVQLLSSPYAVVDLWGAHQGHGALNNINPNQAQQALICRPQWQVETTAITAADHAFIAALREQPLLAAWQNIASQHPDFNPSAALGLLLRQQAICAITLPTSAV